MAKIAFIIGTRAELIKTFPVMLELQKQNIDYWFIHTGQHNLGNLCEQFGIKKPDFVLTKEPTKATTKFFQSYTKISVWNLEVITKIKFLLNRLKGLKYVLYHGDTASTMNAAIASSKLLNPFKKYKNIHLEAGLRSGNLFEPFPEEISRIIADHFSDILFAVSKRSKKNLQKYEKKKQIIVTGNTIIDAALIAYKLAKKKKLKKLAKHYALVSVHRDENLKSKSRLTSIVEIITSVPIDVYWTLHDNTKKYLIKYRLWKKIKKSKNVHVVKHMCYIDFIYHLSNANLLLTDGGSIQEESLIFKKPCVILRKFTERQEGLATGINFLTKLDIDYSKNIILKILSGFKIPKFKNPYGKLGVSKKIVRLLR